MASIKIDVAVDGISGVTDFKVDMFALYTLYKCSSRTQAWAATDGSHFEVSSKYAR
jgi:hypothetical protein